jgi:hypothetical protein
VSLEPEVLVASLALPLESSLCVLVAELEDVGVVELVVVAPLRKAATASHAAAKAATTPVVMRRRTSRRRCFMGVSGRSMWKIVDDEPWILLGIASALSKDGRATSYAWRALRFLFVKR